MLSHTLACCAFVQLRCRYLLYALHARSICDVIRQQKLAVAEIPREAPCYLWPPYGIGQAIIFLPYGFFFFFLSSSFFLLLFSSNVLRTARWKCRTQKSPSGHHRTNLSSCIFATKACINNRQKLVKQQYLLYMS